MAKPAQGGTYNQVKWEVLASRALLRLAEWLDSCVVCTWAHHFFGAHLSGGAVDEIIHNHGHSSSPIKFSIQ